MSDRPPKILLFETEPAMVEMLVASLTRRFDAQVTCVADANMCIDTEMIDPHDLAIVDGGLDHDLGLDMAGHLLSLSARPVILLLEEPDNESVIQAMRLGVRLVLEKPFPVAEMLDVAAEAMRDFSIERTRSVKYARMRDMVRRIIRERRDLDRRMDLVCRDLVSAQRRLVDRVLTLEGQMVNRTGTG